jgi:hypothetical protein
MSIKNISSSRWLVLALEIGVHSHIRHGRQQLRQPAARWAQQRRRQDGPELRILAAAMGPGPLLEGLYESVIDAAHQQVGHGIPVSVCGAIQGEMSEITRQIGIARVPCRA